MIQLPFFFNYFEEGCCDVGYESIQDFFLSWTLRCSIDDLESVHNLLNYYSKKLLYSLLYGHNVGQDLQVDFDRFDEFKVLEIKTKRQFQGIDLLAFVQVQLGDNKENYILNIENKWYTTVREDQPSKYVNVVTDNFDLINNKLVNIVIFRDEAISSKHPSQIEVCLNNNYKFTNIEELASLAQMYELGPTGNHLFDEYWYRWPERTSAANSSLLK